MRETSVYKYHVELKEDVFTKKGYLDLVKVPDLRVVGTGQFLKNLRLENCLRQKDVANILGVCRGTVKNWELNKCKILLQSLIKIAETLDVSRDSIYSLIEEGKFSLRSTTLPVKFEHICDIVPYLSPHKCEDNRGRITLLKCYPKSHSNVLLSLNINPRVYRNNQKIQSRELYNYLTTFFSYTKIPKIHPPLTTEVKGWYDRDVDLKRAIIIPCLQSDGNMDHCQCSRIRFYGKSKILHTYFVDAMYFEYHELPTSYIVGDPSEYLTTYEKKSIKEIAEEVLNLAGNAKTSPAHGQTVDEYMQEPQPHLNYLINAPKIEQQIALRMWASTEGSISIYKHRGWINPSLEIACSHPVLSKQIQKIAKQHDFHFTIKHDNVWSGISKLSNRTIGGCINFLKFGGFIKNVKISANSPYHEGISKNVLILGILEYFKRGQMNKKELPIDVHHHNVNKIIKNREYKLADHYIEYFS